MILRKGYRVIGLAIYVKRVRVPTPFRVFTAVFGLLWWLAEGGAF